MLKFLRRLFDFFPKIDQFLRNKLIKNITGNVLIFYVYAFIFLIGLVINSIWQNDLLRKITYYTLFVFILVPIPYMMFKFDGVRKFIFFGEKQTYEEIFKQFNFRSYFIFVFVFSYFVLIPIVGIVSILKIDLTSNYSTILLIIMILASFFWFAYYIVKSNIPIQKIKTKLSFYTALGSTLSFIFKAMVYFEFDYIIGGLLLSYLWIRHLMELKSEELENLKYINLESGASTNMF